VKKEILKLMETYIKRAEDLEIVNGSFIPPLLDAILGDYNRNVPTARDAEVLNVMATITSRLTVSCFIFSLREFPESCFHVRRYSRHKYRLSWMRSSSPR
jgi:hypothetical protein